MFRGKYKISTLTISFLPLPERPVSQTRPWQREKEKTNVLCERLRKLRHYHDFLEKKK